MKKVAVITAVVVMTMTACNKQKLVENQPQNVTTIDETQMTLQQFAETRPFEDQKNYLLNTKVTDNTADYVEFINSKSLNKTSAEVAKPKIKFRWHGVNPKGHGCEVPLGICIILGGGSADAAALEVSAGVINNKFVISFPNNTSSNFGLTINGYLPLLFDVSIPNEIATQLGITSNNPRIKAGIYQAYYDQALGKYTGIAINM